MALWPERRFAYRAGVVVLFVASSLYLIGFASPFWIDAKFGSSRSYSGLWVSCTKTKYDLLCLSTSMKQPHWLKAVQAVQCLGLIGVAVACVYAFIVNFGPVTAASHDRSLEFLSAGGGLCGFVGCMVFVGKAHTLTDSPEKYLSWAFGINLAGSVLLLLLAGIIFASNRPERPTLLPGPFHGDPLQGADGEVVVHTARVDPHRRRSSFLVQQEGINLRVFSISAPDRGQRAVATAPPLPDLPPPTAAVLVQDGCEQEPEGSDRGGQERE